MKKNQLHAVPCCLIVSIAYALFYSSNAITNENIADSKQQQNTVYPDKLFINMVNDNTVDLTNKLNLAETISDDSRRNKTLSKLIHQKVFTDTEEIIRWSIEQKEHREEWLELVFTILSNSMFTSAIQSLTFLHDSSLTQQRLAIQTIIDNFKIGNINNTDNILPLFSLTPNELRSEAVYALLPLLVQEKNLNFDDLNRMTALLSDKVEDSYYEQLTINWASRDPNQAAKYAEKLHGNARHFAINGVIKSWAKKDLDAANNWLTTIEDDQDLIAETMGYEAAKKGNVQLANEWANKIKDSKLQFNAISYLIRYWYKESPEAGIFRLVFQQSLTTQQKLSLLHEVYPDEVFISPLDAFNNLERLEGLESVF